MERAQQASLEVADSDGYPRQPFLSLLRRSGATIMVLCRGQDTHCRQAVGAERLMGGQVPFGKKALELFGADRRDRFNGDETLLLAPALHRHENGRLAFRSPAAFASGAAPADERIIHLHQVFQPIDAISISHGLTNSAQHAMGRNSGYPDLLGQAPGGQPALVADHQIDCQNRCTRGQIGGIKQRVRRHRGLMTAAPALIDLAGCHPMAVVVPTFRTLKAIGPALLLQCLCAGFLSAKPHLPFHQIHRIGLYDSTYNLMNNWELGSWR